MRIGHILMQSSLIFPHSTSRAWPLSAQLLLLPRRPPASPSQILTSLLATQAPDFGIGPPLYDRELTSPRLRNIAVIRPACSPYPEGLFVQLCLSPSQLDRLSAHPVLAELLPRASWVGKTRQTRHVTACENQLHQQE